MRACLYESLDEASLRLENTYVFVDSTPFRVLQITWDPFLLHLENPVTGRQTKVQADSPELSLAPPYLGYVNSEEGDPVYLARTPLRRAKQGVAEGHVVGVTPQGLVFDFTELVCDRLVLASFSGVFPTFDEACQSLSAKGVAFSKRFCLTTDKRLGHHILWYRGYKVGIKDIDEPVFTLKGFYSFVKEEAELAGVPLGG